MAPSAKYFSFFFLLSLFLLQIHARESQFFSKVTNYNNINSSNNHNDKETETELPNKEETLSKQEQEPSFVPETQTGYGLYGHESGQLPPTTTTNGAPYTSTNLPYKTVTQEPFKKEYPTTTTTIPAATTTTTATNNNYYYNKNAYEAEQQGMSDTRLTQNYYNNGVNKYNTEQQYNGGNNGYNTEQQYNVGNKYNTEQQYNGGNNGYNTEQQYNGGNNGYNTEQRYNVGNKYNTEQQYNGGNNGYSTSQEYNGGNNGYSTSQEYNNGGNKYNTEEHGMSDTRFLENGKYYYDVDREKNYGNGYENTRGVNSRNEYSNRGYYGNNENQYEFNSMEEYEQSQNENMP